MSVRAVLALGSNLGERSDTLSLAVADLVDPPHVRLREVSPVVQTKPVGGPAGQPDYLNMVIEVETDLAPFELLVPSRVFLGEGMRLIRQRVHRLRRYRLPRAERAPPNQACCPASAPPVADATTATSRLPGFL